MAIQRQKIPLWPWFRRRRGAALGEAGPAIARPIDHNLARGLRVIFSGTLSDVRCALVLHWSASLCMIGVLCGHPSDAAFGLADNRSLAFLPGGNTEYLLVTLTYTLWNGNTLAPAEGFLTVNEIFSFSAG